MQTELKRLLGEPQCLYAPLAESMKKKRFDNNKSVRKEKELALKYDYFYNLKWWTDKGYDNGLNHRIHSLISVLASLGFLLSLRLFVSPWRLFVSICLSLYHRILVVLRTLFSPWDFVFRKVAPIAWEWIPTGARRYQNRASACGIIWNRRMAWEWDDIRVEPSQCLVTAIDPTVATREM